MMFGAFINGLNIALHLKDLRQTRTQLNKQHVAFRQLAENADKAVNPTSARGSLPSWSPAPRAQESGFSLRGARWATSLPPAEVVVDMVSRTQSEDRSHSWNTRRKKRQSFRTCCAISADSASSVNKATKTPHFLFFTLIIQSSLIQQPLSVLFSQSVQAFMPE